MKNFVIKFFMLALATIGIFPMIAMAQSEIEVIALRNRPADQIIPILQPLMRQDEAMTGQGFNLIVRASSTTLAQIRQLLKEIDRPLNQLLIQVRFGDRVEDKRQAAQAQLEAEVGSSMHITGRAKIQDTRNLRQQNQSQQIRVLEGGQAWIQSRSTVPLRTFRVITLPGRVDLISGQQYIDVGTGFNVRPQLHGNKVWLEVSPQQAHIETRHPPNATEITTQKASTVIETALGEWIELTTNQNSSQNQQSGILATTRQKQDSQQNIWLKVDLLEH